MQKLKILIVEDEGIVALDLKRHLTKQGYIVTGTARDGNSAIDLAIVDPPDLILMDINIQGNINGIETARQILQSRDIPVIFLTAHSDSATLEEAKSVTPYGYLVKPFEERSLHSSIEMAIHRHRAEQKLKAVEAERESLREQLIQAEKLQSIGTMAGGIAHNFNNLLMAIQGRATLLAMDMGETDHGKDHLDVIMSTVQQASYLTDQLLGLAQKGKYETTTIDLQEMLSDFVAQMSPQYQECPISLKVESEELLIEGDRRQIEHVVTNLLENGQQAMPGGGNLEISLSTVQITEKERKEFSLKGENYIKLSVKDNGVGIDEATRWRIFDPFYTTKDINRSTGLGLSAVYGIVTNHAGHIDVKSKLGEGSTFDVYLPVLQNVTTTTKIEKPKKEKCGIETILLIDDEELIIAVGRAMLERLGFQVLTASNGQEGVDIVVARDHKIDLVLLDMVMPGLNGKQTFDLIHKIEPDIPILIASGYSINNETSDLLEKGACGFLQKPYSMKELKEKLSSTLSEDRVT